MSSAGQDEGGRLALLTNDRFVREVVLRIADGDAGQIWELYGYGDGILLIYIVRREGAGFEYVRNVWLLRWLGLWQGKWQDMRK